jgi:hypothetical protein
MLAFDFHNFYHQHFSGSHAYKAKIMPKLFILMSSTNFVAYLISRAHYVKLADLGAIPSRPAGLALWPFRLKLHLHVYKHKSKQS